MSISSSKEVILKKIRKALSASTPLPFPQSEGTGSVYHPAQQEMEIQFAEQFTKLQGKFLFCLTLAEAAAQLTALATAKSWANIYCTETALQAALQKAGFTNFSNTPLADCDAAITTCDSLVARTGSIVLSSHSASGRTTSVYAPVHICIAYTKQLVYDIKDALQQARDHYGNQLPSIISFASGPSRTADIEKTLVTGVHGPKEVYLLLVDQ
ncbi:MAG TPA: lactate utilization protein [Chitinophagaceae bacterium]|nr:lactate utilization protein [Chitinophagaceae bacterium]